MRISGFSAILAKAGPLLRSVKKRDASLRWHDGEGWVADRPVLER